ncbi:hypothetical protein EXIGLDRAFT_834033 [Exidia glandulosa HHB12029]|uniref:Uncharacterized protein n=1 Tax=Exidia glandulosa HHB12029 TaxID=1314781 RepID=A0A165K6I0_EXIGL|nr:hypothetical protein EXIGLDRAFT_834033 [Exidia glandulosa HHB12029]
MLQCPPAPRLRTIPLPSMTKSSITHDIHAVLASGELVYDSDDHEASFTGPGLNSYTLQAAAMQPMSSYVLLHVRTSGHTPHFVSIHVRSVDAEHSVTVLDILSNIRGALQQTLSQSLRCSYCSRGVALDRRWKIEVKCVGHLDELEAIAYPL